jgi:hypothetical protein
MDGEAKIIISFLFKRSGKQQLSYSELYLTLSMDLNWFTLEDAKIFVDLAIKNNFLTKKGETIKPNFDVEKIRVPVGFYPSKQAFEEKEIKTVKTKQEETVLIRIVKQISEKTKISKDKILSRVEEISKNKNITPEVAAVLIGKECSLSFEDLTEEIEEKILR